MKGQNSFIKVHSHDASVAVSNKGLTINTHVTVEVADAIVYVSKSICTKGCARFPQFVQNFSDCQILWSLCSVDFYTFTLQLPIQTTFCGA